MIDGAAGRSPQDVLSRALRITLGGEEHRLAVLFIAGNERWRDLERKSTEGFVGALEAAGRGPREIMEAFAQQVDLQLDLLYAYDTDCGLRAGVLPPREVIKERLYEDELEAALAEVVKAANPKASGAVDMVLRTVEETLSSLPSSTSPRSTAGRRKSSAKH